MSPRRQSRRRVAFTLIEVLMVLAILVVLGSLAVGVFSNTKAEADKDAARAEMKLFVKQAALYKLHIGQFPADLNELLTNVNQLEKWRGPYIEKNSINDPWGNPYQIASVDEQNDKFILRSGGPSGTDEILSNQ